MEKKKRREKREKKWGVGELSKGLKTYYIQPQQAVPLFTKGKSKGSNLKVIQHFEVIQGM